MVAKSLLFAALFAVALGNPVRRAMRVHETMELPEGFSHLRAAAPDTMIDMRIALTQSDRDGLIKALMDVSEPTSALYGQHLTREEVRVVLLYDQPIR